MIITDLFSKDMCHVCGQTPCNCTHIAESAGSVGDTVRSLYQQFYDQGDDALEYLNTHAENFARYWDRFEGDLDSMIEELPPKILVRLAQELQTVAAQEGLAEEAENKDMTGQPCEKCKRGKYQETSIHDDMDGVLHCTKCGTKVDRWRAYKEPGVAEDVEQSTDDILQKLTAAYRSCVKHRDSYTNFGNIQTVYELLRDPLMQGNIQGFEKAHAYVSGKYPDAFDLLMDEVPGQGVAEGLGKSIKRGLQGWGSPQDTPVNIVKRNKAYDIDTAKQMRAGLDNAPAHSPAGLQKRVLDRRLKGVAEMDNRTSSDDRKEQRRNRPEEKARQDKEQQERLKSVSPEMRKKLRLPEPKEGMAEEKVRLDPKCWSGKKIGNPKTKMKGGVRVNNCVPAESVEENYDNGEYSDEAGMAHGNLITIAKAAEGLLHTIDRHEDLPEWVQEKIAKVEGMLVSAWNYLQSQEAQGIDPRVSEMYANLAENWQRVSHRLELNQEFDMIESIVEIIADRNGVDAETVWADLESLTEDELYVFAVTSEPIMEDWQKANKRDKTDGMSRKAVKAYRREHPGSKLQTAVTTKPSKLKKGSKASKRRKSYCSRSRGQMKMHSISCSKTPDKAICKARRRWNCEGVEPTQTMLEGEVVPFKRVAPSWQKLPRDVLTLANDWFWADYESGGLQATMDPKGLGSGIANQQKYLGAQLQQRGWAIDIDDEFENVVLKNRQGQTILLPIEDAQDFTGWAQDTNPVSEQGVAEGSKKIPASNKPVDPKDLVVSLKDVPVKKPRGHKQYDPANEFPGIKAFKKQGVAEVSDATLTSYLNKVHADSQKHEKDPSKRSPEKANRSVAGFARAFNKLDARKEKTDEVKQKAVPSSQRDPGALATRSHIASQEKAHSDWVAKQKALADEFYKNHPELDDRPKSMEENSIADELARLAMKRNPNALVRVDGKTLQSPPPGPRPAGTTAPRPAPKFDPEAEYSDDYSVWHRRTKGLSEAWARRYPNINDDLTEAQTAGDTDRVTRLTAIKEIIDAGH